MRAAYEVAAVRAAEEVLFAALGPDALMQRAAAGLARTCALLLRRTRGGVSGARVVLLVGSGNNGGDTLWAGARLAARGARVDALLLSDRVHPAGLAALRAAGGRARPVTGADSAHGSADGLPAPAAGLLRAAHLTVDGIVGIGGAGPLRPTAAALVREARVAGGLLVAADVPSGVASDTGAVADPGAVVTADVTVTFGCLKPGLLLHPGRAHTGTVEVVDIGLGPHLPPGAALLAPDLPDLAALVPVPGPADHKYSRGVVGVLAGSARYRGAALLCVGAARRGDIGMVRYLDRGDGLAATVVAQFPDVVAQQEDPGSDPRVRAWACGPGMGESAADRAALLAVLATPGPVVLDADALRHLADPEGSVRAALVARGQAGQVSVLTPHEGEFARLGYRVGAGAEEDRRGAARRAAAELRAVLLLKGPGTVVAAPDGTCFVDPIGPPALATAGSGDVLTGLLGALLAGDAARGTVEAGTGALVRAAQVAAGAAALHGLAGVLAAAEGRPVAAADLLDALPAAVAAVREAGG